MIAKLLGQLTGIVTGTVGVGGLVIGLALAVAAVGVVLP